LNLTYDDILALTPVPPRWYAVDGVPRWCPFTPYETGIYNTEAALIHIACQNCHRGFVVGIGYERNFYAMNHWDRPLAVPDPMASEIGSFHYGDPPRHDCVGDTMNVINLYVVEFWRRHDDAYTDGGRVTDLEKYMTWVRVPAHEGPIEPLDDEPDSREAP